MFQGKGLVPRKKEKNVLETKMNKMVNMGKSKQCIKLKMTAMIKFRGVKTRCV